MGTFWEHLESKAASHVRERRLLYPEPVLKSQKLCKSTKSKINHNILYINT